MQFKHILTIAVLFFCFSSCSSYKRNDTELKNCSVIRYMNLNSIYQFMQTRDKEAKGIRLTKSRLEKQIKSAGNRLLQGKGNKQLIKTINAYRKKLELVKNKENIIKKRLLISINVAVKRVAKRINADYILNIGDEVIYARKKYDITETILREILRLERRKSPVSR